MHHMRQALGQETYFVEMNCCYSASEKRKQLK